LLPDITWTSGFPTRCNCFIQRIWSETYNLLPLSKVRVHVKNVFLSDCGGVFPRRKQKTVGMCVWIMYGNTRTQQRANNILKIKWFAEMEGSSI
jgi:hypothetical protein